MSDLHAVAHAAWDAQWVRDTPPTREEALAAVADAVARAVAEEIATEIEASCDLGRPRGGCTRCTHEEDARDARAVGARYA